MSQKQEPADSAKKKLSPTEAAKPMALKAESPAVPSKAKSSSTKKAAPDVKTAAPTVAKAGATPSAAKAKAKADAKKLAPEPASAKVAAPPVEAKEDTGKKKHGSHKKPKLVRDSFTLPESDYALFKVLKTRCLSNGIEVKKSELLRIALSNLAAMTDKKLFAAVNELERLKTGRPAK